MPVVSAGVVKLPVVPLPPPFADEQLVAFVEVQLICVVALYAIEEGFVVTETVGVGVGVAAGFGAGVVAAGVLAAPLVFVGVGVAVSVGVAVGAEGVVAIAIDVFSIPSSLGTILSPSDVFPVLSNA